MQSHVSPPRKFDVTSLTNAVGLSHRLVLLVCVEYSECLEWNIDIILVNLTEITHATKNFHLGSPRSMRVSMKYNHSQTTFHKKKNIKKKII